MKISCLLSFMMQVICIRHSSLSLKQNMNENEKIQIVDIKFSNEKRRKEMCDKGIGEWRKERHKMKQGPKMGAVSLRNTPPFMRRRRRNRFTPFYLIQNLDHHLLLLLLVCVFSASISAPVPYISNVLYAYICVLYAKYKE